MKKTDNTMIFFISNTIIMILFIVLGFFFLWGLMGNILYKIALIIFIPLLSAFLVEKILSHYVNAVVSFFIKNKNNK